MDHSGYLRYGNVFLSRALSTMRSVAKSKVRTSSILSSDIEITLDHCNGTIGLPLPLLAAASSLSDSGSDSSLFNL